MSAKLHSIEILGLHGRLDIKIPVAENKLILVGVNGLGKTTVVNILYFFLTRQWHRLAGIDFEEIVVSLGRRKLRVKKSELNPSREFVEKLFRMLPPSIRRRGETYKKLVDDLARGDYETLEQRLGTPRGYLERRLSSVHASDVQQNIFAPDSDSNLTKISEYVEEAISSQILYLPTYRRIEQDLRSLFQHFDEDFREVVSRQIKRYDEGDRNYIELVQFGMEDVQTRITDKLSELKEKARLELNELAGSYLRDVISGEAERYKREEIQTLDNEEVDRILGRVEERTLPAPEKDRLRQVIRSVQTGESDEELPQERYLAHFFSKLVEIYRSQLTREKSLREFVAVCNQYLEGKSIEFDEAEYAISIKTSEGSKLKLGHLSSGEKQIVSLFSHMYFSDADSYFIIIDEPELSLSVEWQKRLLPDLIRSGRCDFLAAVTHSPFIFDNELDAYTQDLKTCTQLR